MFFFFIKSRILKSNLKRNFTDSLSANPRYQHYDKKERKKERKKKKERKNKQKMRGKEEKGKRGRKQ